MLLKQAEKENAIVDFTNELDRSFVQKRAIVKGMNEQEATFFTLGYIEAMQDEFQKVKEMNSDPNSPRFNDPGLH